MLLLDKRGLNLLTTVRKTNKERMKGLGGESSEGQKKGASEIGRKTEAPVKGDIKPSRH